MVPLSQAHRTCPGRNVCCDDVFAPLQIVRLQSAVAKDSLVLGDNLTNRFVFISSRVGLCPRPLRVRRSNGYSAIATVISTSTSCRSPFILLRVLFYFLCRLRYYPLRRGLKKGSSLASHYKIRVLRFFTNGGLLRSIFYLPSIVRGTTISNDLAVLACPRIPTYVC